MEKLHQETNRLQPVDIKKVFSNKNPKLARFIPGFIFRYLKKIIHQDEINNFLLKHGEKTGIDFVQAAITDFNVKLTVEGIENIPKDGKYIFASNHPLGGFDGLLLINILDKYFKGIKILVNDILMNITNLHPVFIPINKHGGQGFDIAKKIEETFLSDNQIVTFPAGLVSRRIKGKIVDLVWKKSFINKAVQYCRDIIPVHVSGRNSDFFYRLSNIRKFLGIKANLEMFYLVDETYKHQDKTFKIKFGNPISYNSFDKSKKPREWARWVKEKVYQMDGEYSIPF
jgi:putative hemolysin